MHVLLKVTGFSKVMSKSIKKSKVGPVLEKLDYLALSTDRHSQIWTEKYFL